MSMLSYISSTAAVVCNHSWFKFNNVSEAYISGLTFIGCAGNNVKFVNQFTLEDSSFIGQQNINRRVLTLVQTSAIITGSTLSFNRGKKDHSVIM